MSLAETLIGHMIDPNNQMVTQMLQDRSIQQRNNPQIWLTQQPLNVQAMYYIDLDGRLVARTPDAARAQLKLIMENQAQPAPTKSSAVTNEDLARTLIAIANKLGI